MFYKVSVEKALSGCLDFCIEIKHTFFQAVNSFDLTYKQFFIMTQILIALLITLSRLASPEEWYQLSPNEQSELVIDLDTIGS